MTEFKVLDIGGFCFQVREVGPDGSSPRDWREVAKFGTMAPLGANPDKRAEAYASVLTAEHASGRKPQAFCGPVHMPIAKDGDPKVLLHHREPCDYWRINEPATMSAEQWASVVLCDRHSEVRR